MGTVLSSYRLANGKIFIETEYCQHVVDTCRSWGGKFADGCWSVSESRLQSVQGFLGADFSDLVEVHAGAEDFKESSNQVRLGWYVLASRRSRDQSAVVYADLVAGTIPEWGGSAKYPAVNPSADAVFALWVPRDFAEAKALKIVTDPKAQAASDAVEESGEIPAAVVPNFFENMTNDAIRQLIEEAQAELAKRLMAKAVASASEKAE